MSDIWDTISVEPCLLQPGQEPGWVYFVACPSTRRCKIGYTGGNVEKRMKSLQTGSSSELVLVAKHPGTPETERKLHGRFASYRCHGEWFDMSEELFAYLCLTIWLMAAMVAKANVAPERWIVDGLRMSERHVGKPLPPHLRALL